MEWLTESVQEILNWLNDGSYSFVTEFIAYAMIQMTIWKIEFMAWSVQFSWGIAQAILDQLNISALLDQAFASLDSYILGWVTYLKIPEAVNTLISGFVGKMVMRMMGW